MPLSFDPRLTPARPDLAAEHLRGQVEAARFVEGTEQEVIVGIAPVRAAPAHDAPLLTEALGGERVTIYETDEEGWAWGQLQSDGYVGWLPAAALLAPKGQPTHKVAALRTLVFPGPRSSCRRPKGCRSAPGSSWSDPKIRSPSPRRADICRGGIWRRWIEPRSISSPWLSALSALPICGVASRALASTARASCR